MRILWGALRAVSVEMTGVLVVLWILHSATGLVVDAPWLGTNSDAAVMSLELPHTSLEPALTAAEPPVVALNDTPQLETQRATARQWFNTLFPAKVDTAPPAPPVEQRAEYARERLDHYTRLYGIASRD